MHGHSSVCCLFLHHNTEFGACQSHQKEMLTNLKKAVLDINTKIEYAEMSMELDQYVDKLKEEPAPEVKESAHDELVRLLGLNLNN